MHALHVAAELAAIALSLVDGAVLVVTARVRQILAHRALEEALAALAADRHKIERTHEHEIEGVTKQQLVRGHL